jgi:hypothetical protein
MIQLTIKIKESYYALFLQFLRSLTYVEIENQTVQNLVEQPKEKKFTVVKVAAADRDYTFNREELYER